MNFLELAKSRYSVRNYTEQKVEDEKLAWILEAGRVAPTAANQQPQRLLVIRSKEGLQKLAKAARLHNPPLAIVVCADHNAAWVRSKDRKSSTDIDASIVTDHMMLQATELGLGSLWICAFDPKIVREEFNIPEHLEPINILVIGYGRGDVKSPDRHAAERKPLEETVHYESF
jgi:nitroreductase